MYKLYWDCFIFLALTVVCLVIPFHIAFMYEDTIWCGIFFVIDLIFIADIVVSFFTSIPETQDSDEVTDKRVIATNNLKSWFVIDLMSVINF